MFRLALRSLQPIARTPRRDAPDRDTRSSTRSPGCGAPTPTATRATCARTTTSATTSSGACSTRRWRTRARSSTHPATTLADASRAKFDRLARTLDLSPGDRLLEIGTGWGGFALHAAEHYGCLVTTTTISHRQYEFARERVRAAGLEHRDHRARRDYRDLRGTFDKVVAIEMIEAVDWREYDTFFARCAGS